MVLRCCKTVPPRSSYWREYYTQLPENTFTQLQIRNLDINQGLSPFYGQFDLVHMRFVHSLVDHHTSTLKAIRCLKPGGLILFLKAGPEVTEDRTTLIPAASSRMPDQSWYQRFWAFAELGPTRRGASTEIYNRDFDEGFWDYDIMDAETCGAAFITFPLGAWVTTPDPVETERLKRVGEFWRKNIMRIHRLLENLMISAGRSQKDVELLHTRLDNDLQTARFRSSVTMRAIWGRARSAGHTKSQQQDPSSNPDMSSSVLSNEPGEYRVITTFNDKPAWTEFNTRLISTMTSDTKALREIPGLDLIEA